MKYEVYYFPRPFYFRRPATTSRGTYKERESWFVEIYDAKNKEHMGFGECAPLPDLSCDYHEGFRDAMSKACKKLQQSGEIDYEGLRDYPSILFGIETSMLMFKANSFVFWDTPFTRQEVGIPINGLIWMGDYDTMLTQACKKIRNGFNCIKLKIGGLDFEQELKLLKTIRERYARKKIVLRLDANGAFKPEEALDKLKQLAEFDIHSIEQPIRAGQWKEMAFLAANSPIPIALDEELIGCNQPEKKKELLDTIRPQYLVLKPTLHGSLFGCEEWIREAEARGIGWWATSALETKVGLHAIAQWVSRFDNPLPQGLGTGGIYQNNIIMPLRLRGSMLWKLDDSVAIPK